MQMMLLPQLIMSVFASASLSSANVDDQHLLTCLDTHQSVQAELDTFTAEEKFDFVFTMLEAYGSANQALAFYQQKADVVASQATATHYAEQVLMTWTHSCVAELPTTASTSNTADR